jgi:hypothetical protein
MAPVDFIARRTRRRHDAAQNGAIAIVVSFDAR